MGNIKSKATVLIAVVFLALAFADYFTLLSEINATDENISNLEKALGEANGSGERIQSMRKLVGDTKTNRDAMDSYFVSNGVEGAISFVKEVENLAASAGVSVKISIVDNPKNQKSKAGDYKEYLNLQTEVEGTWQKNLVFLSLLENMPYKIDMDNVASSAASQGEGKKSQPVWRETVSFKVLKLI